MWGLEFIVGIIAFGTVLCFIGLICICLHLPLCPLFCLGLGYGAARSQDSTDVHPNRREESEGAARNTGYNVVEPFEERYFQDQHTLESAQVTLTNSINPNGAVSTQLAQAYLAPPLQGEHHHIGYGEYAQVQGDSSHGGADGYGDIDKAEAGSAPGSGQPQHPIGGDGGSASTIVARGFGDYGMFKDLLFAIIFVFNTVYVIWTAFEAVVHARDNAAEMADAQPTSGPGSGVVPSDDASLDPQTPDAVNNISLRTVATMSFGLASFAMFTSSTIYLTLLMRYSEKIITASIWMSIILFGVMSVLSLLGGVIFMAVIFAVLCYFTYKWLQNAEQRIAFSSTVLKTAISAVKENFWGLVSSSVFMLMLQFVWIFTWSIAMMDTHNRLDPSITTTTIITSVNDKNPNDADYSVTEDREGGGGGWAMFVYLLMILQLLWGIEVVKNVVSSTVSGTLACWYFTPTRGNHVGGALFRAVTTSFGSICLGSLLVAFLQVMRFVISTVRERATSRDSRGGTGALVLGCTLCLAEFLLRIIERLMEYFNQYAFTYTAAYGTNYLTSGLRVMDLFKKRGWTGIINDSLVRNALFLVVLAIAVTTGTFATLIGVSWSDHLQAAGIESPGSVLFLAGFVMGLAVGILLSNILESAVISIFVFYAEDPRVMQRHHPALYDELTAKWLEIHPDTLFYMTGEMAGATDDGSRYAVHNPIAAASAPPVAYATPV